MYLAFYARRICDDVKVWGTLTLSPHLTSSNLPKFIHTHFVTTAKSTQTHWEIKYSQGGTTDIVCVLWGREALIKIYIIYQPKLYPCSTKPKNFFFVRKPENFWLLWMQSVVMRNFNCVFYSSQMLISLYVYMRCFHLGLSLDEKWFSHLTYYATSLNHVLI